MRSSAKKYVIRERTPNLVAIKSTKCIYFEDLLEDGDDCGELDETLKFQLVMLRLVPLVLLGGAHEFDDGPEERSGVGGRGCGSEPNG